VVGEMRMVVVVTCTHMVVAGKEKVEEVTCRYMVEEEMEMEVVGICTRMLVVDEVMEEVVTCIHKEVEEMVMEVVETCIHKVEVVNYKHKHLLRLNLHCLKQRE
jgi:hypothetical protein